MVEVIDLKDRRERERYRRELIWLLKWEPKGTIEDWLLKLEDAVEALFFLNELEQANPNLPAETNDAIAALIEQMTTLRERYNLPPRATGVFPEGFVYDDET
ncbi:hypothetical protein [Bosea sp. TAF32]|uniref:hypothetical protein n=1 Tax=Bosea sp. TAF32 TaxID=3237482 RepID=UPI003F8EB165